MLLTIVVVGGGNGGGGGCCWGRLVLSLLGIFNPAHSATLRRVVPGGTGTKEEFKEQYKAQFI